MGGNTSNTSLLAVADDGTIQVRTQTTESRVIIDITGYYTSTQDGASAGGFTAMAPVRALDTRDGTGVSAAGTIPAGSRRTLQVTGANGIPAGAAAVAVNIIVINREAKAGWVRPTPNGEDGSTGSLNYNSTKDLTTAMNAQVGLGSDGKFFIDTASGGGRIDLVVDIQGYFLPANPGGGFTPTVGRLLDTRDTASITSGSSLTVQVAGQAGAPTVEGGLSAVALTFTAKNTTSSDSYAKIWADGATEPASSALNSDATSIVSNTVVVPVGANGKVRIKNMGPAATDYIVDLQGVYNSLPGGPGKTNRTGQRTSATTLPFPITDQTNASVDVGTGNLLVTTTALNVPGVTQNTTIGAAYNSRATNVANTNTMDANRWQYALAGAGDLTANSTGVVYTDAAGTAWQFTPTGTQGAFTSPAGLQQTLTRVDSGSKHQYELKGWTTNSTTTFNLAGQPTKIVDRNSNETTFTPSDDKYTLKSLTSTAGVAGAKTVQSSYANGRQTFSQTSGSSSRSVSWAKSSAGDITTYTDATGKKTTFAYTSGDLTSITAPTGGVTAFTYDSSDRVTKVEQRNTTAGSAGTAVTRFSYASDTSTQVADPRSDQSATIAAAAHTTYTLDANDLVTKTVDPAGRERSKTYNSANNGVLKSTTGASGDSGTGTTSNEYGKNSSQSLTKSTTGSGSSSTAEYGSGSATAYLPSKVTDSSGNSTTMGYDGVGNQTSSQSGSDTTIQAKVAYNSDGTVKSATAPGNGSNSTTYTYDGNKQLSKITPPTGTTLGVKTYTYDAFGRVATETDGRGNTTTYGYDADDRQTSAAFSDGTATVTNVYDGNGNQTSQASATGTITNSYDQRNRLVSTVNTAGGGTVSYGYDLAGNTAQVTDSTGTVSHTYDASEVLTATTYPTSSGTAKQIYLTDPQGRRTDTWLGADASATPGVAPSTWSAHQKLSYDKSGKVTKVQAWAANEDPQLVVDTDYCYMATTTAPTCTTSTANDRSKLQWSYDNISKQATNYGYTDTDGKTQTKHLTGITQSGGTNPTNWAFTYDDAGNRTEAKATNATTSAVISDQKLTYNAASQITTDGYTYDGTGNLTAAPGETYTYNGAQQLTSSTKDGVTTSYEYAGADMNKLLWQATDGGAEYGYTYGISDSNGVPVIATREQIGTGTASVLTDPVTGQPLDLRTSDNVTSLYVLDGIGNPAMSIADTGKIAYQVSYDAYGAETVTKGESSTQWQQNPYGYKAGLRSSNSDSGLTKFGYRWFSATTGSWAERDTLDVALDPGNANRYAFVGCDPVNGSDPTGRVSQCGHAVTGLVFSSLGLIASGVAIVGSVAAEIPSFGWSTALGVAGVIGFGASAYGVVDGIGSVASAC
ncbi:RHS repeat-associated core domain-containing protein [Curtobacterium sp. A7_M15]|uniref:RHS repeat protein n=1 Tax=Curtobacterium sp. A7_M15 TaxID=3065241 RepID=UPI002737E04D|nr:RHS repeat-associated core domain-containing protein [Curtobacterium sp. A7_M15]MDP4332459.1 RHS repeat-associated core domain-containing protein [Curtobacterium sp. A7_M15]